MYQQFLTNNDSDKVEKLKLLNGSFWLCCKYTMHINTHEPFFYEKKLSYIQEYNVYLANEYNTVSVPCRWLSLTNFHG